MEYKEQTGFEFKLDEMAVLALRESAKWSFFLSIIGFIGVGFMVVLAFFVGNLFSSLPTAGMMANFSWVFTAIYLLLALFYFFPIYYLFKYATDMKTALVSDNNDLLSNALGYLKSHHKYMGITVIVVLSLYVLMIIGVIVGTAMAM